MSDDASMPAPALEPPVVVLTGAGLSTASGIPDYRSADGMWKRFGPDEFTIDAFLTDPDRFWARRRVLTREMRILDAEPNAGHRVLAEAVKAGRVACIITQNIDGLHTKAGTPPDKLLEVHGNAAQVVCMDCGTKEPTASAIDRMDGDKAPRCRACGGYVKPDVVLFGERVELIEPAAEAAAAARTFVAAGTSLQVYPVAGLVDVALRSGASLILLNRDPTPYDDQADHVRRGPAEAELVALFGDDTS